MPDGGLREPVTNDVAVAEARSAIADAEVVVAFTGAGVSTASGIPSFSGEGGIWTTFDPEDFRYERFVDDPAGFWKLRAELTRELALDEAEPNACHRALAEAYDRGELAAVVTQNIDGLHQQAGVPDEDVVEIHGSTRRTRCVDCGGRAPIDEALARIDEGQLPPECGECGGVVKPDVVLFGEQLPAEAFQRAQQLAREADVMLVAGSSLTVWPAAGLPERTLASGGELVVVNTEATKADGRALAALRGRVETVVPRLLAPSAGEP
jgi:NAD-dependent deacetylase